MSPRETNDLAGREQHLTVARDLLATATEYVRGTLARAPAHRLAELEGMLVRLVARARTARGADMAANHAAAFRAIREAVAAQAAAPPAADHPMSREEVIADLDRCLRYDVAAEARLVGHDEAQREVIARLEAELESLRGPEAA